MKAIAYVIAVLAAVGIVVAISSNPATEPVSEPTAAVATTVAKTMDEPGELTLDVPGMHCQFACFPRVKETLEATGAVTEVALAEQPDPNALTVKQVIVRFDKGFEPESALARLHGEGFTDAAIMQ